MIIFESILTTFQSSIVYRGSYGSSFNWPKPKIKQPYANLDFPNPWNPLYMYFEKRFLKFMTWWSEKSLISFEIAGATGSEAQVKDDATKSGGPEGQQCQNI